MIFLFNLSAVWAFSPGWPRRDDDRNYIPERRQNTETQTLISTLSSPFRPSPALRAVERKEREKTRPPDYSASLSLVIREKHRDSVMSSGFFFAAAKGERKKRKRKKMVLGREMTSDMQCKFSSSPSPPEKYTLNRSCVFLSRVFFFFAKAHPSSFDFCSLQVCEQFSPRNF